MKRPANKLEAAFRCAALGVALLAVVPAGGSPPRVDALAPGSSPRGAPPAPAPSWLDTAEADRCALSAGSRYDRQDRRSRLPLDEVRRLRQRPRAPVAPVRLASVQGGGACSPAAYAALAGSALVEAIATSSEDCLGTLWSFDADVAAVIAEPNLVLVSSTMTADASDLSGNVTRLERMAQLYQIAFFHAWYQPSVDYGARAVQTAQMAVLSISASPDFFDESAAVKDLREQWALSIDGVNGTHLATGTLRAMLERYHADPTRAASYQERVTVWHCLFSLQRQIGNNARFAESSPWYGLLDAAFVDSVAAIALDTSYPADAEYVVLNALFTLGRLSHLDPPVHDAGHRELSNAYALFEPYGTPWLETVMDLDSFYGAALYDGAPLDVDRIRRDVTAIALPNTFTFDQGRTVFRTAVSHEAVRELYDALQEVESQFFRKTTFVRPVPGDTNEAVTLVIYGSPEDYSRYQPFLHGLPTNNGGIYIEGDGRLYTYQRTPQQSRFTLEELLRHEFAHYLDSRFVVVPSFGDPGSLYEGSRLVWYTEGLAEFMVGSTRTEGVLARTTLLEQIENDSTRMTVSEIVGASYVGGFRFYPYAGTFFAFLQDERPSLLVALFDAVRADDIPAVDALFGELAGDAVLQQAWDEYLTRRIDEMNSGLGSFAEDVPTVRTPANLPQDGAAEIAAAVAAELPTDTGRLRVWPGRFRHTGVIGLPFGGSTDEAAAARDALSAELDGALASLATVSDNFTSAVAWFGDPEILDGAVWATYAVEGPYLAAAADTTAPLPPSGLVALPGSRSVVLDWIENGEVDLAGYHVYRSTVSGGPYQRITASPLAVAQFADRAADGATTYHYRVTAVDSSGNESAYSAPAEASIGVKVLLVDGYFSTPSSYASAYADALDSLGVAYVTWDTIRQGEVPASVLASYADGLVVWAVGYFSSPSQLSPTQQAAIQSYLDAGGSFVFSGAYKALALDGTPLFTDYLHCDLVGFNINLPALDGAASSVLGDGMTLRMDYVGYESEVDLTAPATPSFTYDPVSGPGAVGSSGTAVFTVDTHYRVVYLAFPFADIEPAGRLALLGRVLDWTLPAGQSTSPEVRFGADKTTLSWRPLQEAQSYSVYRGSLADLADGNADGLPDSGFGECRNFADDSADTVFDTFFSDPQVPLAGGEGQFYLVAYRRAGQEQGLGSTSAGSARAASSCP